MEKHLDILTQLLIYYSKKNFTPQINTNDINLMMGYFKKHYIDNYLK
jgi:hypothetical protein